MLNHKVLLALDDNFYAHRRGNTYISNDSVMIWFKGNSSEILKIDTLRHLNNPISLKKYQKNIQIFHKLSLSKVFGHINVNRNYKISLSTNPDIREEYIYPLNDSILDKYKHDTDYKPTKNGWFILKY